MSKIDSIAKALLKTLELLGLTLAVIVVTITLLGIFRSIWRVTRRSDTLVLPFAGGEAAAPINRILSEQLTLVEERVRLILAERKSEDGERANLQPGTIVDVGPLSEPLPEFDARLAHNSEVDTFIAEIPNNRPIGPIGLGGINVSPESLFAISYHLRSQLARRTIRGSFDVIGSTGRLAVTIHGTRTDLQSTPKERRPWMPYASSSNVKPIVVGPILGEATKILDLVNDAAFCAMKVRLGLTAGTGTWEAYSKFAGAYTHHLGFLATGNTAERDAAIGLYEDAVEADPTYGRAHYNLANMLYDRYSLEANAKAISHFSMASRAGDTEVRALGYAGLAMAYCQNIQRFRLEPRAEWLVRASSASRNSVRLRDLPETRFAKAWFLQVSERYNDAVAGYLSVLMAGDSKQQTTAEVQSFALNNAGWICMAKLGSLTQAEEYFTEAQRLRPNKMIYANLGELNRIRGDFDAAVRCYEQALELDSFYVNGINELGVVYLAQAGLASEDAEKSAALLSKAYACHLEALAISPAKEQRRNIRRAFESSREACGLSQDDVKYWADDAERFSEGEDGVSASQ